MRSSSYQIIIKKLGKRIVQLRKEKGLRQIDLANKLEWEKNNINTVEFGLRNLSVSSLIKIAEALDVTLKDLFD